MLIFELTARVHKPIVFRYLGFCHPKAFPLLPSPHLSMESLNVYWKYFTIFDVFLFPVFFRSGSAGNGIFQRRLDFSAFNGLPWHKLNSYHIKVRGWNFGFWKNKFVCHIYFCRGSKKSLEICELCVFVQG